jgi:hypothetical protein
MNHALLLARVRKTAFQPERVFGVVGKLVFLLSVSFPERVHEQPSQQLSRQQVFLRIKP